MSGCWRSSMQADIQNVAPQHRGLIMAATAGRRRWCTAGAQELLVLGWLGAAGPIVAQYAHQLPGAPCSWRLLPTGCAQGPHRSSAFMAAFCALFFSAAISSAFCTQWVARWLRATR